MQFPFYHVDTRFAKMIDLVNIRQNHPWRWVGSPLSGKFVLRYNHKYR